MIPSGYSSCWYIFYHCYLKNKIETLVTIVPVSSFSQTKGLSIFGKWPAFKENLKFYILVRGLQPPRRIDFSRGLQVLLQT